MALAAAAAPLLARAFGHPELASVAIALGTSFAVNGIAVQPLAVLARRLRFGATFWVETAGVGAGGVVVVGLATAGCGPWALVGQTLASALVRAALALGMSGYAPRWPRFGSETAGLIRFGGYVAAYGLVNAAARNMDNVLIGSVWGLEALGYYTRAYFLMTVPLLLSSQALAGPTIPALSAVAYDAERLGRVYRSAARLAALLGFPLAAGLFVVAPEAVRLLYGPGWDRTAGLVRWLAVAALVQTVVGTSGWLYLARARPCPVDLRRGGDHRAARRVSPRKSVRPGRRRLGLRAGDSRTGAARFARSAPNRRDPARTDAPRPDPPAVGDDLRGGGGNARGTIRRCLGRRLGGKDGGVRLNLWADLGAATDGPAA